MTAVLLKELNSYFKTPVGYVYMGLFLLVSGFFFTFGNLLGGSSYYTAFLGNILFLYIFSVPLLTMRLLSEERRQRTDQLLLTSPISIASMVLGKFIAAFLVFLLTLIVTILYATVVGIYGDLAVWETVGGYIGFSLLGSSFLAIGILVSSVSRNQLSAAFMTFFALLLIWFIDMIKSVAPEDPVSGLIFAGALVAAVGMFFFSNTRSVAVVVAVLIVGLAAVGTTFAVDKTVFEGFIARSLDWLALLDRIQNFNMGLLKLEDLVYYLSFTGVLLYLTIRIIEKRRWA